MKIKWEEGYLFPFFLFEGKKFMKNNLSYLKTEDFSIILNNIHKEIQQKMEQIKENDKAKEIESFLRQVKKTARQLKEVKTNSAIINTINKDLSDLIQNTFYEQIQMHTRLKSATALFRREHSLETLNLADDIFEEELGYLIKAAAKMRGQNIDIKVILGGGSSASSNAIEKLTNNTEQEIIKLINTAMQNQAKNINKTNTSKIAKIQANTGKVDISVPSSLHVTGEIQNDLITNFLSLIAGATFSLKNYSSFQKDIGKGSTKNLNDIQIHLGNSNIYKAVTGALSEVLSDPRAQKRVFFRGMTVLAGLSKPPDSATQQEIFEHFAHLKFIYELRGSGLIDKNGNSKIADYIIWNDPNSDNIAVRSTASLIKEYWQDYAKTLGSISISAFKIVN